MWRTGGALASAAGLVLGVAACTGSSSPPNPVSETGIHKIKHVIVIMQENRSFDSYFGTFPGADGLPANVCVPTGAGKRCERPLVDHADVDGGGPHGQTNATADIDGGRMDGFVEQAEHAKKGCKDPTDPACANAKTSDVMGYHTERDIPNYWTYAKDFVLQDHMFEPNASWSLPDHQIRSFDAYDKFIEDDFLHGQRLDPRTDGRPDPRPDVREDVKILGNLVYDFDFTQRPRPPVLLPVHPTTTLTGTPKPDQLTPAQKAGDPDG